MESLILAMSAQAKRPSLDFGNVKCLEPITRPGGVAISTCICMYICIHVYIYICVYICICMMYMGKCMCIHGYWYFHKQRQLGSRAGRIDSICDFLSRLAMT